MTDNIFDLAEVKDMTSVSLRKTDTAVYEGEILPWLPPKMIDIHVHVGLREHTGPVAPERKAAVWAIEIGIQQTWDDLRAVYSALFPKQSISALVFGGIYQETDIEANNDYIRSGISNPANKCSGLAVTRPEWDPSVVKATVSAGFSGIKPYPDLAPRGMSDSSIFDFLPHSHLEVIDSLGGVVMLHLPRPGRLADPDNISEIREIAERYPSVKLIIAHIGRSFCLPTAQAGLPHFTDLPSVYFDTSANLNADVFHCALDCVGPDRLLFGSDLPITSMRGVREHIGDKYINYTDGPYSWNVNRKSAEEEAGYTFYLYEELRAIIAAVRRAGLGPESMEKMLYSNSAALLGLP